MSNIKIKYKCPECGWIGEESEMGADSIVSDDYTYETWSNWICPSCNTWQDLEDYKEIKLV